MFTYWTALKDYSIEMVNFKKTSPTPSQYHFLGGKLKNNKDLIKDAHKAKLYLQVAENPM